MEHNTQHSNGGWGMEGLLWFDSDPKKGLAEKVAPAVARFRERMGREARTVLVASGQAPTCKQVNGVRVMECGNVMPGYIWVTDANVEG